MDTSLSFERAIFETSEDLHQKKRLYIVRKLASRLISEAIVCDATITDTDEAIAASERHLDSLPSARQCLNVLAKELSLPEYRQAKDQHYREEIRPLLDTFVGFSSVLPLAAVCRFARRSQQNTGDDGPLFYVPERVVGGVIIDNEISTTGYTAKYSLEPIYKLRTMHQGAHSAFMPGQNKGPDESFDDRIIKGMNKYRHTAIDELPQALQLLQSSSQHAVGLRALEPLDHEFAYGESCSSSVVLAQEHLETLNEIGVGLVGPMHQALHSEHRRDQDAWQSIIRKSIAAHRNRPHTLRSDIDAMLGTGRLLTNKVAKKLLRSA